MNFAFIRGKKGVKAVQRSRFLSFFFWLPLFASLLLVEPGSAQSTYFNKRINIGVDSLSAGWGIVEASNGNGHVLYADENLSYFTFQRQLLRIDSSGNVLQHKTYREDSVRLWNGGNGGEEFISWKDGYLLAGSREDVRSTGDGEKGTLWHLDENFDTVWTRTYDHWPTDSNEQLFKDIEYLPNEEAFLLTGVTGFKDPYGWVVKTDTNGNVLWKKKYGKSSDHDFFSDLTPAFDSGYIAVGRSRSYSQPDGAWVVRLDTAGNKVWQKVYESDSLVPYWLYNIHKTPDSNYVASGQHHDGGGKMVLYYDKFKPNGISHWKRTFWDSSSGNVILLSTKHRQTSIIEGMLYTLGWQMGFDISAEGTGYLHKLSLGNGERLWKRRSYNTTGTSNADGDNDLYDFVRTDDGGFIAVGLVRPSSLDSGNTDIWIVGMDSVGCDTPNCATSLSTPPEPSPVRFELFPNPNDGRFNIISKGKGYYDARLTVRTIQGEILLQEKIKGQHPFKRRIKLEQAGKGTYLVEWKEGNSSYVRKVVVQ